MPYNPWVNDLERNFYSHKAGNQKGHAHQAWCQVTVLEHNKLHAQ